jgi:hypothetical protein
MRPCSRLSDLEHPRGARHGKGVHANAAAVSDSFACNSLVLSGACAGADQDRVQRGADRRARFIRQGSPPVQANLDGRDQRPGGSSRPAGKARLLRRSEQSADGAGHLHEAPRRRQSRPHRLRLRHQHDGACDAGRDRAQSAVSRPFRVGGKQRVPLLSIFLDAADRARPEARFLGALLQRMLPKGHATPPSRWA